MPAKISLIGRTFGRLKVIADANPKGRQQCSLCLCQCGKTKIIINGSLKRGDTQSCGCRFRDAHFKHGHARNGKEHPLYRTWLTMWQRCTNSNIACWMRYGGRGIRVCDRWRNFQNFLSDMGGRPHGRTLDRIDGDGHYDPSNCRWATAKEQTENRKLKSKPVVYIGIPDYQI